MIRNEPGGGFTATNVPLNVLIRTAYRLLDDSQMMGLPGWIAGDHFDIAAKAENAAPPPIPGGPAGPLNVMLQQLLADRFKLAAHIETRELPVYTLMLARSDGTFGARLHRTTVDCAAMLAALFPAQGRSNAPPPSVPTPGQAPPCGAMTWPNRLTAQGMTMARLALNLSGRVGRVVLDGTGLAGDFDLDLEWMPDQFQGSGPLGPPPGAQPPTGSDNSGPSIYRAVQEQLGLKLESTRGPVDVLVIDHIEQPSPD